MEIGKVQKLKLAREKDFGVYLEDSEGASVLLPKKAGAGGRKGRRRNHGLRLQGLERPPHRDDPEAPRGGWRHRTPRGERHHQHRRICKHWTRPRRAAALPRAALRGEEGRPGRGLSLR